MKRSAIFEVISIGIVFLSFAIFSILKIQYVDDFIFGYTGVSYLGGARVFINDSIIYFGFSILFYVSYLYAVPYIASVILRSLAFFLLFIYVVDFYLLTDFSTHLILTDVFKYAFYSIQYFLQINDTERFVLSVIVIGLSVAIIISHFKIRSKLSHFIFGPLSIVFLLVSISSCFVKDKYIHSWLYNNFISHNLLIMSEQNEYSEDFIKKLSFDEKLEGFSSTLEEVDNIILLMVESLSSYQSNFFSGLNNWTPNLDLIAEKNSAYTSFYANGFTTEDGEISLLTGLLPIYQPSSFSTGGGRSFSGFFNIKASLPNILKEDGYVTEFITTADLKFGNTGEWARSIGFDIVEGHDHPYYQNWERFHFKSAPDKALYNRIIQRVKANDSKKCFYFIKTVTSHHPYINPETKNRSEEETIKYVDKSLGEFYENLIKLEYFNKGILIIVGDHRAMIPLKNNEIQKFGAAKASAMVPLVVCYGDKKQSLDMKPYQQVDVFNSLAGLVSKNHFYSNWIGSVLDNIPPKYIAHRRGDHRNIISVISGEKVATVLLDGDETRIKSAYPKSKDARKEILDKINSLRIRRK